MKTGIYRAMVTENRALAPATYLMTVHCPPIAEQAAPGTFVKFRCWSEDADPFLDRPFSIHRVGDGRLSLLYRLAGPATRLMSRVAAGTEAKVTGPLGRGLDQAGPKPEEMYLAAGGVGLAPMALVRDWLGPDRPVHLFYGERSGEWQVDRRWLESLGLDCTAVVEDGSGYGRTGLVTGPLAEALAARPRPVFACGPLPMLAAVSRLAAEHRVPALVSVEAGMACGFGVCLSCSLPKIGGGRFRACLEGPVADGATVDWDRLGGK